MLTSFLVEWPTCTTMFQTVSLSETAKVTTLVGGQIINLPGSAMSGVRAAAANMHRLGFRLDGAVVGHAQIGALASDDVFFLKPILI